MMMMINYIDTIVIVMVQIVVKVIYFEMIDFTNNSQMRLTFLFCAFYKNKFMIATYHLRWPKTMNRNQLNRMMSADACFVLVSPTLNRYHHGAL